MEKMRRRIERYRQIFNDKVISITMSFGICEFDGTMSLDDCVKKADASLYDAKKNGRNRTVSFK